MFLKRTKETGVLGIKKFWSAFRPFLISKGFKTFQNKFKLPKQFNRYHINIRALTNQINKNEIFKTIIGKYTTKSGNKTIKNNSLATAKLHFKFATVDQKKGSDDILFNNHFLRKSVKIATDI